MLTCAGRFSNPPDPPRVPLAKLYVRTRPSEDPTLQGLWLFGAPSGYEQSCTVFALARGFNSKEAVLQRFAIAVVTFIITGRWVTRECVRIRGRPLVAGNELVAFGEG